MYTEAFYEMLFGCTKDKHIGIVYLKNMFFMIRPAVVQENTN